MSNISDFNTTSNSQTDHEHEVQLGLLQALCRAAKEHQDPTSLGAILDQHDPDALREWRLSQMAQLGIGDER